MSYYLIPSAGGPFHCGSVLGQNIQAHRYIREDFTPCGRNPTYIQLKLLQKHTAKSLENIALKLRELGPACVALRRKAGRFGGEVLWACSNAHECKAVQKNPDRELPHLKLCKLKRQLHLHNGLADRLGVD